MGSLSPLATKTGRSIAATRWSSEWLGMPHAQTASYCAWRVCHVVGSSRSVVLAPKMRPAACWPASRDTPQQVGTDERDLLCDEAANREAEQIDSLKVHRLEK